MKLKFIAITLAVSALAACSPSKKEKVTDDGSISARTPETENLLAHLKKVSSRGFMFGHHDDTNYGIEIGRASCRERV